MFGITGLLYIPDFVSADEEISLLQIIDARPWRTDLNRRTQHYGYIYDYKARRVDPTMYLGALPDWLISIAEQLVEDGLMPIVADQAIINEYEPGQGIADHIDCTPCFGDVIASLSLGSAAIMDYKCDGQKAEIWLDRRSIVTMRGVARYEWTHGIAKRKSDFYAGQTISRQRRVSVTFRKTVLENH
jgi:alkylated DNA repair dioxygenase AlkB